MADIFISYRREDRDFAKRLSEALEERGYEVWWDFDLRSGDRYRSVIQAVLDECKVAIVLWSARSVQSDFVMDEAEYAKALGKICPARIDNVALPFGFGALQTTDLRDWTGQHDHPAFEDLLQSLEKRVGPRAPRAHPGRSPRARAAEMAAFTAAEASNDPKALMTYLDFNPSGEFAGVVRSQLADMEVDALRTLMKGSGKNRATAQPPPPAPPAGLGGALKSFLRGLSGKR
jgi:hypothetical protein